jgi:DNA-binding response OmpR family regulator
VKVLIVDDEIHVATMLADALVGQGHTALIANDGEEGLALFRAQRPDGVFLDVRLGELSGVDVLRQIRQIDPSCPVIIITGHASDEEVAEIRRLGATDILEKPMLLNRLTEALSGIMAPPGTSPSPRPAQEGK